MKLHYISRAHSLRLILKIVYWIQSNLASCCDHVGQLNDFINCSNILAIHEEQVNIIFSQFTSSDFHRSTIVCI